MNIRGVNGLRIEKSKRKEGCSGDGRGVYPPDDMRAYPFFPIRYELVSSKIQSSNER